MIYLDMASQYKAARAPTGVLKVMVGVISTMEVDAEKCRRALSEAMLATDVAYYLVRRGVSHIYG